MSGKRARRQRQETTAPTSLTPAQSFFAQWLGQGLARRYGGGPENVVCPICGHPAIGDEMGTPPTEGGGFWCPSCENCDEETQRYIDLHTYAEGDADWQAYLVTQAEGGPVS